jgi:hypothetical protein
MSDPCQDGGVPKRSSKPKKRPTKDPNVLARFILEQATGEAPAEEPEAKPDEPQKNPAAVALGRMGGLKGGAARAKKLSKKRRAEIAKKAARTRWSGKK